MSDSWPSQPRAPDSSDSLAGQAFEVERALKALEAVDTFHAEAAALRAELQALRASGALGGRAPRTRRPAFRRRSGDVPEGAWRLAFEVGVIAAVAFIAWAVHLGRLGIVLSLVGTWVAVAVFEAVASRSPAPAWIPPPPLPSVAAPPVPAVARPAPAPTTPPEVVAEPEAGWPSRPEAAEPFVAEPPAEQAEPAQKPALELSEPARPSEPEPEPRPEPAAVAEPTALQTEIEPDGGPAVGAFAVLEEHAAARDLAASRRPSIFRRLIFGRRASVEALPEPQAEPVEPELQAEPIAEPEPRVESDAVLVDESVPAKRSPRFRRLRFGRSTPADPVPAVAELQTEPEVDRDEPWFLDRQVEPDGGPSVGAFAVLEEDAARREQEPPPAARPSRFRRRPRRRSRV